MPIDAVTAVTPRDSFERWHEVTCTNYSLTDCSRPGRSGFGGAIAMRAFGPLWISDVACTTAADDPITVTRRPAHLGRDHRDDFMLWLTLEGEAAMEQDGYATRMRPGDLVLHDQTRPFTLAFAGLHRAIMLTIPRPLLVSRVPTARRAVARPIAPGAAVGRLAAAVIRELVTFDASAGDPLTRRVAASALDIVATAIDAAHGAGDAPARQLDAVKRFVLEHLGDAGLDIAAIAKARDIAPRTLNRMFAREGTTPIRWLWQQRLAASYRALAEGSVVQVSDAAAAFGFRDPSHFSRAFRAAFGCAPLDVARRRS